MAVLGEAPRRMWNEVDVESEALVEATDRRHNLGCRDGRS